MTIKSMTATELKNKFDQGDRFLLVDVREQNEWDDGHIPGAQLLCLSQFESGYTELSDKSAEIILQCRSGKRSRQAAEFLQEQGYTNLTNLEGGILGWIEADYETTQD